MENFWKVEGFGTRSILKSRSEVKVDRRYRDFNLFREDMRAVDIVEKITKFIVD